jgi:uncharacterized protein with beta-barrel porin domain
VRDGVINNSSKLRVLLASSSVAALLIAAGPRPALAACTVVGPGTVAGFTNPGGHTITCVTVSNATVTGNVVNAGTITPGSPTGILVTNSTIDGSLSNSGTISVSGDGILGGIVATFLGGITSSGTITAGNEGIYVLGNSNFAGGITNGGVIRSGATGILINDIWTFSGGITNSGTISAAGDGVGYLATISHDTFTGNISNGGTITVGGDGILVEGFQTASLQHSILTSFAGAVVNTGNITAGDTGIQLRLAATVTGGVTNNGSIVAAKTGILVTGFLTNTTTHSYTSTFAGGIVGTGTIRAGNFGINLTGISNFSGGISSGSITAAADSGIAVTSVSTFAGGITSTGAIQAGKNGIFVNPNTVSVFTGDIVNQGTITPGAGFAGIAITGTSGPVLTLTGNITNNGTIKASGAGAAIELATPGVFNGGIVNNGTLSAAGGFGAVIIAATPHFGTSSLGFVNNASGIISYNGTLAAVFLNIVNTFQGGITNAGIISAPNAAAILLDTVTTFSGGLTNTGTISGKTGIVAEAASTWSGAIVNNGNITGTGGTAISLFGLPNAVTIDQQGGSITGAIKLSTHGDTLNISGGAIAGNIVGQNAGDTINFNLGSGTFTYAAPFGFSAINQVNVNSGTVILDGTNQTTNTTVAGGTLEVGDAANPAATLVTNTVAVNGGTLAGTGTIDPVGTIVTINSGATLAPGPLGSIGTLTIGGSLTINAGSFYDVSVNDTAASKTLVTSAPGTATINGGTVVVTPQYTTLGAHGGTTFAILTATGGRSGTFAGLTVNSTTFTGSFSLSYDADDAYLNVGKGFVLLPVGSGGSGNGQNVANGINNAILAGNTVPNNFNRLLGLSNAAYLNALNQLDGEDATGAERGAFDLMNEFLGLMLDPFVDGRAGSPTGSGALGFAPDQQANLPSDLALAYAGLLKAPPPRTFDQRWTTWAAGFGGSATSNGDPIVGSNNVTTSTYGYAAGMDYHFSPDTVLGFSLAGGGTNWNLANALGTGRSDAFLAGIYGVTHKGPWYLGGALAFANNWFTTNRTAMGDQLTASFQGQNYSARLEGGYRFAVPIYQGAVGITPYAALQAQDFHTPSYSETDLTGGGFGLTYNAMSGTDTRSELGSRFDDLTAINNLPLILRAKVAWAHDWVSNPALNASFESLPAAGFTVNGAQIPHDSALTSAGAQLFFTPNWSLIGKFDGEFAGGYQLYAGSGTLRYTW